MSDSGIFFRAQDSRSHSHADARARIEAVDRAATFVRTTPFLLPLTTSRDADSANAVNHSSRAYADIFVGSKSSGLTGSVRSVELCRGWKRKETKPLLIHEALFHVHLADKVRHIRVHSGRKTLAAQNFKWNEVKKAKINHKMGRHMSFT